MNPLSLASHGPVIPVIVLHSVHAVKHILLACGGKNLLEVGEVAR